MKIRIDAGDANRAAIGGDRSHHDVQHRGLARSGTPEQRHDLAARHLKADVVDRDDAAEGLAHIRKLDDGGTHRTSSSGRQRRKRFSTALMAACSDKESAIRKKVQASN